MSGAVVVGGGAAGLLAARLLKDRHEEVVLVEREAGCGGLLGSIVDEHGVSFDYGAHLLSDTGVAGLDALLYAGLDPATWRDFRVLRAGNWFGGAMNSHSPFPDARRLGPERFRQGMAELRARSEATAPPAHLGEALERRFGASFAREVVGVGVSKQLGEAPEALHPDTPFALRRLVCGDPEESRALKREPALEEPVAYASYEEGVGEHRHRYPREGGIGQWLAGFEADLRRRGVEIANGRTAAGFSRSGDGVEAVLLDDGRALPCVEVAWTLPSAMLLRAAGIAFESRPPTPRPIGLFHLTFDRPFPDGNYHVTCYDAGMHCFRVTLYPNLRAQPDAPPYNCTVEVIGGAATDFPALTGAVVSELAQMGITSGEARLLASRLHVVPMGFPATTPAFMAGNADQAALAAAHLGNVHLLGRARCPPFFTSDVLIEVYRQLGGGDGH